MSASFFRYPGGKSKLRKEILRRLSACINSKDIQYREPFFGGGSIGSNLFYSGLGINRIWINDKDIGIACLWTSVINYPKDLKEHIRKFSPSTDSFYSFKEELITINDNVIDQNRIVDIGFKKLAIHQISYSGLGTMSGGPLGGEEQESKYKINCRWSPGYICSKIDLLHRRLSFIEIYRNKCTSLDFADLIKDDNCNALLYLDPPYYVNGNSLYQCGFTVEDHVRLALLLKSTKHLWVLSYDNCPEILDLYSWANIDVIDVNYTITATKDKNTGRRLSRTKPELLITPKEMNYAKKQIGFFFCR